MGKDFVRQSIIANVSAFVKKISDVELFDLVMFVCYTPNVAPTHSIENDVQRKFVDEVLGASDWKDYIDDLIKKPYFFKCSYSFKTNLDFIEKILHSEVYFRFQATLSPQVGEKVVVKEKEKVVIKYVDKPLLTKSEKGTLSEILSEHKAMLEYQLEDEDAIRNCDDEGEALVDQKKKHLGFIEKFGKLK